MTDEAYEVWGAWDLLTYTTSPITTVNVIYVRLTLCILF